MKILSTALALCLAFTAAACEKRPWRTGFEKSALPDKVARDVRERVRATGFAPVIIRLNIGADLTAMTSAQRAAVIARASEDVLSGIPSSEVQVVHRYSIVPIVSAWADNEGLAELAERPAVEEIVLDRLDSESLDKSVRLIAADSAWMTSIGKGRFVAILDDGIDRLHPFVIGRVPFEACFRKDGKCRNQSFEQIGTGAARNMARGHGMHVAGIAAGGSGMSGTVALKGVAPGVDIIAINIFSERGSYVGDQVKALEYVALLKQANVHVVAANLSLGDKLKYLSACDAQEKDRKPIIDRLLAMGVATVVAAGNEAQKLAVSAPGCISTAVTVSSVTNLDRMNLWHNRSSLTDFAAPGEQIRSSVPDTQYGGNGAGDYADDSGTSMAAPHVSGAIALLSAAAPGKSLNEILTALSVTGKELADPATGLKYKRIDVKAALAHLVGP